MSVQFSSSKFVIFNYTCCPSDQRAYTHNHKENKKQHFWSCNINLNLNITQ